MGQLGAARPRARSARTDAEPEGRHGDVQRRAARCARRRPARSSSASTRAATSTPPIGKVSFAARSAGDELHRVHGSDRPLEAGCGEGRLRPQRLGLEHDGPRRRDRHHSLPVTSDEENREGAARHRAEREARGRQGALLHRLHGTEREADDRASPPPAQGERRVRGHQEHARAARRERERARRRAAEGPDRPRRRRRIRWPPRRCSPTSRRRTTRSPP